MNPYRLFQRGQIVQIINDENPLYGEIGEIDFIEINGRYIVKLVGGQSASLSVQEIGLWLGYEQEKKLYKAQLIQMQMLAVDTGDRHWFDEIGGILKGLEHVT